MTADLDHHLPRNRVRVWFGPHLIAEHLATPEEAADYAAAMGRRFASLLVTNEPAAAAVDSDAVDS